MKLWAVWVESGTYADSHSTDILSIHLTEEGAKSKALSFPVAHRLELTQRWYKPWVSFVVSGKNKGLGYGNFFEFLERMTWDEWEVKTTVKTIEVED